MPLWISFLLIALAAASVIYIMRQVRQTPQPPWSDDAPSLALLAATIENWPSKTELAAMLQAAGIGCTVGAHAIRLQEHPAFVFRDLDGPAPPTISGDHDSAAALASLAQRVSAALSANAIRHRFEVYDGDGKQVAAFTNT